MKFVLETFSISLLTANHTDNLSSILLILLLVVAVTVIIIIIIVVVIIATRQVTRATHVRTRVCPRVELILKIIIILLIIFLGFIKSKPC